VYFIEKNDLIEILFYLVTSYSTPAEKERYCLINNRLGWKSKSSMVFFGLGALRDPPGSWDSPVGLG
jgi:hypothetical protein